MASRSIWSGQLRLSLVSIPIEIHSAVQTGARLSFRQIHGPSGKPVRYEKTVAGVGPIKTEDILKGYELDDDEYLLLDPADVAAIRLETKKTFELVQFVAFDEISPLYYDHPYYIIPTDDLAEDAYRVVRDALRKTGRVGLGQLTMRGKEYLCAVRACGDGLLMETLRYADEVRKAEPLFRDIDDRAPDEDLLSVATQLIERKTAPFKAEAFHDHYEEALRALVEAKKANRKSPRAQVGDEGARPKGTNVVDLLDALRQSLKASGGKAPAAKAGPAAKSEPATRRHSAAQKDAAAKPQPAQKEPAQKGPAARKAPAATAASAPRKPARKAAS